MTIRFLAVRFAAIQLLLVILLMVLVPCFLMPCQVCAETGSPYDFDTDPGPKIIINIPAYRLYFYRQNQLVTDYPIAVGKTVSKTMLGEYTIVRKAKNPTWYPPDGSPPVPPGPNNPVGSRWLGLNKSGYGIHGTNAPSSIGKAVSLGCIRMYEEDVKELYDIAPIGTRVKFIYETIVVTTDPMLKETYITVFPDIYQMGTNTLTQALNAIKALSGWINLEPDEFILSNLLKQASGKPSVFPKRVEIAINGLKLKSTGFQQRGEPMLPVADLLAMSKAIGVSKIAGASKITGALKIPEAPKQPGGSGEASIPTSGGIALAQEPAGGDAGKKAQEGALPAQVASLYGRSYIPLKACAKLPGFAGATYKMERQGSKVVVYLDLPANLPVNPPENPHAAAGAGPPQGTGAQPPASIMGPKPEDKSGLQNKPELQDEPRLQNEPELQDEPGLQNKSEPQGALEPQSVLEPGVLEPESEME